MDPYDFNAIALVAASRCASGYPIISQMKNTCLLT